MNIRLLFFYLQQQQLQGFFDLRLLLGFDFFTFFDIFY